MARILVLGADGMVGHIARIYLTEHGHRVVSVARSSSLDWINLDVENERTLIEFLEKDQPEFVLNCVGVLIQESEADPLRAIRLNALMPHVLSKAGASLGFRVIHISSDCVFSGIKGPYRENDLRDSNDVYGRTKALGELQNNRDLTIRTSKIGPELHSDGTGLFNWLMRQTGTIKGFSRMLWGGVTTLEMAKAVEYWLDHPISGLVHLTNNIGISKCDLIEQIARIWGKNDVTIFPDNTRVADRSLICTRTDWNYVVPSYAEMLEELFRFMEEHIDLYSRYMSYSR